jgi:capsular exopolysaccharide synthesis family protein
MVTEKSGIKDALEKARQKRLAVLNPKLRKAGPKDTATERQAAIQAMPKFALVEYDPAECRRNRVILPDEANAAKARGAAEYRMLRTRILQRTRANDWHSIGVTSPGPGDGKSLTTINLAMAVARERNNNVFLIDLDMRNPRMCGYLGATPPADINRYLLGTIAPEEVLFSIGIDNLTLAGTLTPTDQSSELLASGRIEELFAYIRSIAPEPLILVDLPPILSTDDALVIAPKVDACLLVLSEGRSRRDSSAKALELLTEFNLAGIVLNRSRTVVKDYYNS